MKDENNLEYTGSSLANELYKITEEYDNEIRYKRISLKNSIVVSGFSNDQDQI